MYREFTPDILVATDRPIATAIQQSGYALQHQFYTRRPLDNFGAKKVTGTYFGYSSGPIAVALAAEHGASKIYMLGFDMGPTSDNQFNNLYAGTEFYKNIGASPTFTGNWIKQLLHIAKDFPATKFVRVHGPTTAAISQFDNVVNFETLNILDFQSTFAT